MVSYREDFDLLKCTMPCCKDKDETIIHSQCHPKAPTWVCYKDGELTIKCSICKTIVVGIVVPERYPF